MTAIAAFNRLHPPFPLQDHIFACNERCVNIIANKGVRSIHPSVKDIIFDSIKENKPLTMTRYNDGEWIALLTIHEYNKYNANLKHKIEGNGGREFVDEKMMPIIQNIPEYYMGISSQTIKHDWIMNKTYKYISKMKLYDGGIFSRWLVHDQLNDFLDLIKERNVILVGPKYLQKFEEFFPKFTLVHTGDHTKSWTEYDRIKEDTFRAIENIDDMPIILYCASFVGKVILDDVYHKYENVIQFDLGSVLDSFVKGSESRSWHKAGEKL